MDWLLKSRIRPSPDRGTTVERHQLLKQTLPRLDGRVLLISAPPGYGKTALLVDLGKHYRTDIGVVAWFTLDITDEPLSVLRYLYLSLEDAGLELPDGTLTEQAPAVAIQALLAAVERSGQDWLLILDNAGAAGHDVAEKVLSPLVRFMPARLTIALATDGSLSLPLSELVRRGLLSRVDARDLAFHRSEIKALAGRGATDHHARLIERRSSGWPAIAQLMIESRFGVNSRRDNRDAIRDFLNDRLLASMRETDRDLFARLALLNRFSLALVSQLTGTDSEKELNRLLERGLVCRVASDEGLDLTVHPAFLESSRQAFERSDPDEAEAFRAEAARVYLATAKFAHATEMAVTLGDEALLDQIIEACNPLRLWFELGVGPLRRIVDLIPDGLIWRNIRIGYAGAIYWSKIGRLKAGRDLFDQIERRIEREGIIDNLPPRLRIERLMCRTLLAIYQGTPLSMADVDALEALAPALPDLEPLIMSAVGTQRCYVLQAESAFGKACATARDAILHAERLQSEYAAFFLHCDIAMINGVTGDVGGAWSAFQAGERSCQRALREDERLTLIRDAFRLELQHEIDPGQQVTAARLRNICRRLPGLDGWPDVFAAAFGTYSEKLVLWGDDHAAMALIDAATDYADRQGVLLVTHILEYHRVLLLVLADRSDEAQKAFDRINARTLLSPGFLPWRAYEAMVEARGALAYRFDDPDVETYLYDAIMWARRHGNVRSEIRFRSLRDGLFPNAEDAGIVRALKQSSGFERASEIVSRIRSPRPSGAWAASEPTAATAFFTEKERAVLAGVEQGLSDKALALELGITPHGVRYHLKRIYAQLGVHTREDACRRARERA